MSFKNFKKGEGSAMLIFVVFAAVGVIILILFLARSPKFQQVKLNIETNQEVFNEQLLELGEHTTDTEYQDGRIVFNMDLLNKFDAEICKSKLDFSSPKSTEIYKNKSKGLEFSFPYSSQWGNKDYILKPYDELGDSVYFGPLKNLSKDACNISRAYVLNIHKIQSTNEILESLKPKLAGGEVEFKTLLLAETVKYLKVESASCKSPSYYVMGVDYDYEFTVQCSDDIENDFIFLEQIINTLKFR